MAFEKGHAKMGGRKKGTPHKKSLLVREVLENHGINLVEQILVRLPQIDKQEQVRALVQMLPYVYPKLTSVEHSGEINNPYLTLSFEDLKQKVKERLK